MDIGFSGLFMFAKNPDGKHPRGMNNLFRNTTAKGTNDLTLVLLFPFYSSLVAGQAVSLELVVHSSP
jgi:hypothetical protein